MIRDGRGDIPATQPKAPGDLGFLHRLRLFSLPGKLRCLGKTPGDPLLPGHQQQLGQDPRQKQDAQQPHTDPEPLHFASSIPCQSTLSLPSTVSSQVSFCVVLRLARAWRTQAMSFPAAFKVSR